jgi:hypothetical protein
MSRKLKDTRVHDAAGADAGYLTLQAMKDLF